jgi:hypothetical protein
VLGSVFAVLMAFPIFLAVDSKRAVLIALGYVATLGLATIAYGPIGGFMPALATGILTRSGNASWGPATLLAIIALISLAGSVAAARIIKADGQKAADG